MHSWSDRALEANLIGSKIYIHGLRSRVWPFPLQSDTRDNYNASFLFYVVNEIAAFLTISAICVRELRR